jgi:peptidoglycan/xylan/chitin deacetylase (PgdA/CDA1 family)
MIACLTLTGLNTPGSLLAGDCDSVSDIEWMIGHWSARSETRLTTESWVRSGEHGAQGHGRAYSVPDFRLKSSESISLGEASGAVFFTAEVAHNAAPVSFRLTACDDNTAVFENPDHDFPTRIAYTMDEAGHLRADVSGPDGGGFSIPYVPAPWLGERRIALTFDDAPRGDTRYFSGVERTRQLIDSLARVDAPPVIFFSTTRGLDEGGDARMRSYQEAGHYVGNHSDTHQRIARIGVKAFVEDVRTAHAKISGYPNFVPLFRFPFLNEGRDIESRDRIREALAEMGYRNGYVTVDNYDFYMDSLLQRAVEQGREIHLEALGRAWVESLMQSVRFYADMADRHIGHNPAHTLLLHENDLAALFVDELVEALRAEGWAVIDALAAYDDPMASVVTTTLFNNQGRVAAIAEQNGVSRRSLVHANEDTGNLDLAFEKYGAFGAPYPWHPRDSDLLFSSNRDGNSEIYLLAAGSGEWLNLTQHPAGDNFPVWSPDGQRIAFQSSRNGKLDVFVMNADGSGLVQLTGHADHDYLPSWTADGNQITFVSWRREAGENVANNHVYIMNADGSDQRRLLEETPGVSATVQWTADGNAFIQTRRTGPEAVDLFLAGLDGREARRLTDDGRFNSAPHLSPSGDLLAFYSELDIRSRLDVMALDGSGRRTVLDHDRSWYPRWSPDGCWLIYTAAARVDQQDDLDIRAIRADGSGDWLTLVSGSGREAEGSWRPVTETPELTCN